MKIAFHLPKIEKNEIGSQLDVMWRILMPRNSEDHYDHFRMSSATKRAGKLSPSWPPNRKAFRHRGKSPCSKKSRASESFQSRGSGAKMDEGSVIGPLPMADSGEIKLRWHYEDLITTESAMSCPQKICRLNPVAAVEICTSPRLKTRMLFLSCILYVPWIHEVVP